MSTDSLNHQSSKLEVKKTRHIIGTIVPRATWSAPLAPWQSIWKNNVCLPGRTRSQKRSRRWFPGWTPSHRSPVWSSPTQQRNTRFIERPWSFLQTHLGSRLKTTLFLKTNFIHLQVHLCRSLLEVTQGFRWAFGVVSAAAGRDALLFKVLCVAPVGEIMHPAAMQLHGNENGYSAVTNALQVFWLKNIKKKRGEICFLATMQWRDITADVWDRPLGETSAVTRAAWESSGASLLSAL